MPWYNVELVDIVIPDSMRSERLPPDFVDLDALCAAFFYAFGNTNNIVWQKDGRFDRMYITIAFKEVMLLGFTVVSFEQPGDEEPVSVYNNMLYRSN